MNSFVSWPMIILLVIFGLVFSYIDHQRKLELVSKGAIVCIK
jgi:hypothetical protein